MRTRFSRASGFPHKKNTLEALPRSGFSTYDYHHPHSTFRSVQNKTFGSSTYLPHTTTDHEHPHKICPDRRCFYTQLRQEYTGCTFLGEFNTPGGPYAPPHVCVCVCVCVREDRGHTKLVRPLSGFTVFFVFGACFPGRTTGRGRTGAEDCHGMICFFFRRCCPVYIPTTQVPPPQPPAQRIFPIRKAPSVPFYHAPRATHLTHGLAPTLA